MFSCFPSEPSPGTWARLLKKSLPRLGFKGSQKGTTDIVPIPAVETHLFSAGEESKL